MPCFISVIQNFRAYEYLNGCTRCTQMHTKYYLVDIQFLISNTLCVQKEKSVCKLRLLCAKRGFVCRACANLCRVCADVFVCVLSVITCKSTRKQNVCSCVHVCAAFFSRTRAPA